MQIFQTIEVSKETDPENANETEAEFASNKNHKTQWGMWRVQWWFAPQFKTWTLVNSWPIDEWKGNVAQLDGEKYLKTIKMKDAINGNFKRGVKIEINANGEFNGW